MGGMATKAETLCKAATVRNFVLLIPLSLALLDSSVPEHPLAPTTTTGRIRSTFANFGSRAPLYLADRCIPKVEAFFHSPFSFFED